MSSPIGQVFVQSMLSRGALTAEDTVDLYNQIATAHGEARASNPGELKRKFAEFVLLLNKQLKPFQFELCKARLEDDEQHWYAVVNRAPDAAAKIGSKFSAQELEFFNKAVKLLVLNEGVVSSGELLKNTCEMERKMTADAAQKFLKTAVKEHWFSECDGKFTAGPRFILELRPFLSEIYGEEVKMCEICEEPVIRGQQCEECEVKVHLLCMAIYANNRSVIHCPSARCRKDWPHEIPDIQLSTTTATEHAQKEGPPPTKQSRTSRRH